MNQSQLQPWRRCARDYFHTDQQMQRGATLITSLVILLILLMAGLALANITLMSTRSTNNEYSRELAFRAAEFALGDAEFDIENSSATGSRSAIFSPLSSQGFIEGCGRNDGNIYQGLCLPNQASAKPVWLTANIGSTSADSASVQSGRFTGRKMPVGAGTLPVHLPRYLIELIADQTPGQSSDSRYLYRITAIGFGTTDESQAVVQAYYRKSAR